MTDKTKASKGKADLVATTPVTKRKEPAERSPSAPAPLVTGHPGKGKKK